VLKSATTYLTLTLASTVTLAQPARCSSGYQDASCVGYLANLPQVAPTCSNAPGWQTTAPAVWQGSHYSAPGCTYTPPPTCPAGMTQTGNPTWNGSSWVGLVCTPASAPPSPLSPSAGNAPQYSYSSTRPGATGTQSFIIWASGTWAVTRAGFNPSRSFGTPTSGTWTSDGSLAYEYTITRADNQANPNTIFPDTTTTTWTPLTNSLSLTARTPGAGVPEGWGAWTVNLRQRGTISPVLTIDVELETANGD
jgi:hypothetical protein